MKTANEFIVWEGETRLDGMGRRGMGAGDVSSDGGILRGGAIAGSRFISA